MDLSSQLASGRLVCPLTHEPLSLRGDELETADGRRAYRLVHGVPILLAAGEQPAAPQETGQCAMVEEYTTEPGPLRRLARRLDVLGGDFRTEGARRAIGEALRGGAAPGLFLSVGGGPTRAHPCLVNLNIGPFPNVDVVGSAYALPYADGAVDGIHCEAVLEHLEHPEVAVAEMFRTLATGGRVYAATPFLQAYHGYPDHFQGFTLAGHTRLFERAGFRVLDRGVCVGPAFALSDLARTFLTHALGGGKLGRNVGRAAWIGLLPFRALDLDLGRRDWAPILCSTTYVLAEKVLAERAG